MTPTVTSVTICNGLQINSLHESENWHVSARGCAIFQGRRSGAQRAHLRITSARGFLWYAPLLFPSLAPKLYWPHPTMSAEEIRQRMQSVWDTFHCLKCIRMRSRFINSMRARLALEGGGAVRQAALLNTLRPNRTVLSGREHACVMRITSKCAGSFRLSHAIVDAIG